MKKIIETIKSNREELISKYFKMKKELEVLGIGINQAMKLGKEDICEKLRVKRYDLSSDMTNIGMAINDLTNALNHLGESTETFWG